MQLHSWPGGPKHGTVLTASQCGSFDRDYLSISLPPSLVAVLGQLM